MLLAPGRTPETANSERAPDPAAKTGGNGLSAAEKRLLAMLATLR